MSIVKFNPFDKLQHIHLKKINKRPMGHIAHLRKTIQIKNTLIKRRKNPLFTLWELNENLNGSSFEQTWITFIQGCIVPSLVEIGPVVLEKKMKMWKDYKQTDGQTNRRRTTGDQESSLEISAQVSKKKKEW